MVAFDCCQYCNQVLTLAWKNRVLKLRNWSTLLFELAIPVLIIYALVVVKMQIKPSTDEATLPSEVSYVRRLKVFSFYIKISILLAYQFTFSKNLLRILVNHTHICGRILLGIVRMGTARSHLPMIPTTVPGTGTLWRRMDVRGST